MADSIHVFDATQENFETEVMQASFDQPILVDLWAEWCGPCKTLGPLLEKVVDSFNGAVRLAKVDVDKEQALASMFGVRSIPTVALIRDGQFVDGFAGALPESKLREFIARHAQPLDAPATAPAAPAETPEQTVARLRQEIAADPERGELKLELALALMQAGEADAAQAELDALPANLAADDRARRLRGQLDFARVLRSAPPLGELQARVAADGSDWEARDLLGVRLLIDGQAEAGLEQFLAVLKGAREWNDGLARQRLIAAFAVLDDADLVGTYRRRMSSLLF